MLLKINTLCIYSIIAYSVSNLYLRLLLDNFMAVFYQSFRALDQLLNYFKL